MIRQNGYLHTCTIPQKAGARKPNCSPEGSASEDMGLDCGHASHINARRLLTDTVHGEHRTPNIHRSNRQI